MFSNFQILQEKLNNLYDCSLSECLNFRICIGGTEKNISKVNNKRMIDEL